VRRRVATIVAIDAGQDQKRNYDDLGNAIRKCYADFGVVIDIHADALKSGYHAVGRIIYPDAPEGTLIYLKPSLTGCEPADLLNYSLTHPGFPHHVDVGPELRRIAVRKLSQARPLDRARHLRRAERRSQTRRDR
jgi:hypothetical protein